MLDLANLPDGFHENPFPHYDALLADAPVCPQPDGSFILSKHADLNAIYRATPPMANDNALVYTNILIQPWPL